MNNDYVDAYHSHEYYKGKSIDFAGIWTSGVRYFNDEFLTNFVVYAITDSDGTVRSSALLACKKTHMSKTNGVVVSRQDNEPRLVLDGATVVGIEPNDYWLFICGSLQGVKGDSTEIVDTYLDALAQAKEINLGKVLYVKEPRGMYVVTGSGTLTEVVIGDEVAELQESKVDKVEGKGLSTEDYTTEEKEKLEGIEEGAQANVIEEVKFNGTKLNVNNKSVNIEFSNNVYTVEKLVTPEGDYLASYVLRENGIRTGSVINIPKDKAISSGTVETAIRNGYPYSGAVIGDKYIDILLNDTARTHIYIPANKLVDAYTGDKYIKVDAENKTINLDYNQLESDLNSSIKIGVSQVNTLSERLTTLESPTSKVVSIGTVSRPLTGAVILDNRDFTIDTTTNSVSLNFNSADFDTSGMADRVREELLGKKSDVLDFDESSNVGLSLYGIKNALIDINDGFITSDNLGEGLVWANNKASLHTKSGSSVQVNENGEVILVWS